jgi:hypothetical protein
MKAAFIGKVVQLSGVVSAAVGLVLSFHHIPAAVTLIGGGVAYFVGIKLQGK